MNADELDDAYTLLCTSMTDAGPDGVERVLARLTLLLMHEVGDVDRVRSAISTAADLSSWPSTEEPGRSSFAQRAGQ